jgi:spore maturation protein CgeB
MGRAPNRGGKIITHAPSNERRGPARRGRRRTPEKRAVKLVIFGLTLSSSWGNGHATLWRGLCRALVARGHRVVFFEQDRPYYAAHRDYPELPGGRLRLYPKWDDIRAAARRELEDADAGLVSSYCGDALAATELLLESPVTVRAFYDLDTPVTLEALGQGQRVDYLGPRGLADYDLVLSFTGGRALEELQSKLGARHVVPLYGSVDPAVHRPVLPETRFAADLSYLGTYAADRQAVLETLFIDPARQRQDQRFVIGGAQYPEKFPWAPNIYFVRHLEPAQHPAFFCSSRLTLNVTRRAMKAMGYCPSGRLFEAAACGAPLLSDHWEGIEHFLAPGREILIAGSAADTIAALDRPESALRRMGAAARERILQEHTSTHRALELEHAFASALAEPTAQLPTQES